MARRADYIRRVTPIEFTKMHGAGNDFIVIDERTRPLGLSEAQIVVMSDRRRGVGCDQFITLHPPPPGTDADVVMRIRNPDGSESGACGNATRCVAELLFEENGRPFQVIRTAAGDLPAVRLADGRQQIDMGAPRLGWRDVPLAHEMDTLTVELGAPWAAVCCSMGNPHATLFVPDVMAVSIATMGPALEHHALFPERANIGVAQVLSPRTMRLRVWERGAGLTQACGSGACAALVAAVRRGLMRREIRVEMDGGMLDMVWRDDGHVLMTGPTALVFRGTISG